MVNIINHSQKKYSLNHTHANPIVDRNSNIGTLRNGNFMILTIFCRILDTNCQRFNLNTHMRLVDYCNAQAIAVHIRPESEPLIILSKLWGIFK